MVQRFIFLAFICLFLISCGGEDGGTTGSTAKRVVLALVDDQAGGVPAASYTGQKFTADLAKELKKSGHQVTLYKAPNQGQNRLLAPAKISYSALIQTFSSKHARRDTDALIILRLQADPRQYGLRQTVKTYVVGEILDMKKGNISQRFRTPAQQTTLSNNCTGACMINGILPLVPRMVAAIKPQILAKIGDYEALIKQQTQEKFKSMQADAPDLVKKGEIDQNEAVFLSLTYNIELRGVNEPLLGRIEPILAGFRGYEGHKVAFRTPEKQRFILHYRSRQKMTDLRDEMTRAIEALGYSVKIYIYASTFQVYVTTN